MIRGEPYFIIIFEDISLERMYWKQQEAKKQNLIQLASIVHDLKTPLNCIKVTILILKAYVEKDQPSLM